MGRRALGFCVFVAVGLASLIVPGAPPAAGADGDIAFAAPVGAARGTLPVGVVYGAFGGPGTKLLATADLAGTTLRILDGTLAEVLAVPGPTNPVDIAAGDFDDDGYTDLAFVVASQVEVWMNAGTGGTPDFPGVTHTLDGGPGAGFARLAAGDLNGGDPSDPSGDFDHFDDIVAIGTYDDGFYITPKAYVLQADRSGAVFTGFLPAVAYICNQAEGACAIGDVTDDGKADVVALDTLGRQVVEMLGNGKGVLNEEYGVPQSFGTTHHVYSVAIGDVTGDGKPDVITGGYETFMGSQGELSVHVLRWTGSTLESANGFQVATQPTFDEIVSAVAVADLDGDGDGEIAVTNPIANAVSVLSFTAFPAGVNPFFLRKDAQVEFPCGDMPFALAAGDVAGDTSIDLATANNTGMSINLLTNTTGGGGGGGGGGGEDEENPDLHPVLPATTQFNFISKKPYQDGKVWKFNATQPDVTPGIAVRVQSTSTPSVESSWTDIPGGAYMSRIGSTPSWIIKKVTRITRETGDRLLSFRTITTAPGYRDGISAPLVPEQVAAAGPLLKVEVNPVTLMSAPDGYAVEPGGTITYVVQVTNVGTEAARSVRVTARPPKGTVFLQASHAGAPTGKVVAWPEFDLQPDAVEARLFAVTVPETVRGGTTITVKKVTATYGDRGPVTKADPAATQVRDELSVSMTSTPDSPRPGDLVTFLIRIKNEGSAPIGNVALLHSIPDRAIAYDQVAFSDSAGQIMLPPRGNPAPALDRAERQVLIRLDSVLASEELFVKVAVRLQYDRGTADATGALLYRAATIAKGDLPVALRSIVVSEAEQTEMPTLTFFKRADADGRLVVGGDEPFEVATVVMPKNAANGHRGIVTFTLKFENEGNAYAPQVQLTDAIPARATLVGTMMLDGSPVTPDLGPANLFRVDLGAMDPGTRKTLVYEVEVASSVNPGADISAAGGSESSSYLKTPVVKNLFYQAQARVDVLAVQPVTLDVSVASSTTQAVDGTDVTYPITIRNNGGIPATGVVVTVPVPQGMTFQRGTIQGRAEGDGVAHEFSTVNMAIGTMSAGQELTADLVLRVTLTPEMAQRPYSEVLVKAIGSATNQAAKGGGTKASHTVEDALAEAKKLIVAKAQRDAALFLGRVAPLSVTRGSSFTYILFYGNLGDFPATGARIGMEVPFGTKLVKSTGNASFKKGIVTWDLGTVQPHAYGAVEMIVQVDADFSLCSVDDKSTYIESDQTPHVVPPRVSVQVRSANAFFSFWESFGCALTGAGRGFDEAKRTQFGEDVRTVKPTSRFFTIGGADVLLLRNGTFVVPLGGGNIVAGGGGNIVAGGGGNLIGQDGAAIVKGGGGNLISIKNLGSGLTTKSGSDLLANIANSSSIVAAGGGNIVAGGGGNLIGLDGASVVANDGAGLIGDGGGTLTSIAFSALSQGALANIVAGGGGNIVAAGGGNIVAGGGGNIFSPLIGHDGASIVAAGGGNLTAISNGR